MTALRLLFLGAGKRLSLLERFVVAAAAEDVTLEMLSIERHALVPIASVAQILPGPSFDDPAFDEFLVATAARERIDAVVPNMDAATKVLARCRACLASVGVYAVVSDADLCEAMEDKILSRDWFAARGLPIPEASAGRGVIAKRRHGFGSRDQIVAESVEAVVSRVGRTAMDEYIVQPLVQGPEYTVDAYVARDGRLIAALSRIRHEVSAGEVDLSETHRVSSILDLTRTILAEPGWRGPITLQFILSDCGPVLIEINPRFGGGVTHSIQCGLDMPRWLIREHLGRPIEPVDDWVDGSIMTRCRRDVFLWR